MANLADSVLTEEHRIYLMHLRDFTLSRYRELTSCLSWVDSVYGPYMGKDQGAAFFLSTVAQLDLQRLELFPGDWQIASGGGEHSGVYEPDSKEMFPHVWLKNSEAGFILDLGSEYITGESIYIVEMDDVRYVEDIEVGELSLRMMESDYLISSAFNDWFTGGERVLPGSQGKRVLIS